MESKVRIRRNIWIIVRLFAVVAVLVGTGLFAVSIYDRIAAIEVETADIQVQIDIQRDIRLEIEDQAAFVQSRDFIERMARTWHGLVHRDEIIFIRVD